MGTGSNVPAIKSTYDDRCDRMLRLAAKHGLLVMLDPIETGDFLKVMFQNGPAKCREFGRYVGNRYQGIDNLLWLNGNDYQKWRDPTNDAVVTAVALGIKDCDARHLHTIELDYEVSGSLDDPNWVPIINLCASYTYYPTYAQVLKDYNRSNFMPVCLIESDYEFEQRSTPATLRREEYWVNLSGATGQLYGNTFTPGPSNRVGRPTWTLRAQYRCPCAWLRRNAISPYGPVYQRKRGAKGGGRIMIVCRNAQDDAWRGHVKGTDTTPTQSRSWPRKSISPQAAAAPQSAVSATISSPALSSQGIL